MKKNKLLYNFLAIFIIVFILLEVVDFACFDKHFYTKEHQKYKINEYIGVSEEDLSKMVDVTLNFLKNEELTMDLQLEVKGQMREIFNDKEKLHMNDVRKLYQNMLLVKKGCLFIIPCLFILLFILDKFAFFYKFRKYYFSTLLAFIAFIVFIIFYVMIDFDAFWTNFHKIFFTNDMWLLSLKTDLLIMMVPPEFFNDLVIRIVILIIISISALSLLIYLFGRRSKYD